MLKYKNYIPVVGLLISIVIFAGYSINTVIDCRSRVLDYEQQLDILSTDNQYLNKDNQILLCDNEMLRLTMDSLPLGSPIYDTLKLSSKYGVRRNPLGVGWNFHSGIDIYAAWSDTVQATGDGIITMACWFGGYGRCITIKHVGGYESYYAHLYKIFVQEGDSIKKGQAIGRAGNSGAVTGPHLHYEIRRGTESTDPLDYIR